MTKFLSACSAGALLFACGAASAQTVDYGALEEMFGEPVTMSATGKPQRVSEAPASMQIISGEVIRRSGANKIAEVLQNYAGIEVNQWAAGRTDVAIRGGASPSNPRLLVLVNGRQVYLDYYGFTNWDDIGVTLAEIRQIEVVRGPNSALFGFNAATGVVNILTYNALRDDINAVTLEAGNRGHLDISGTFTLHMKDKVGLRLSGGYQDENEYALPFNPLMPPPQDGLTDPKDATQRHFGADSVIALGAKTELELSYNYSKSWSTVLGPNWLRYLANYTTNGYKATLTSDSSLGLVEVTAYQNTMGSDNYPLGDKGTPTDTLAYVYWYNKIGVMKVQDLLKIGAKDTVRLSAEYRYSENMMTPDFAGKIYYRVYSGGGMWEHAFSNKLTATAAARIDKLNLGHSGVTAVYSDSAYDRSVSEPSYNLSLVYKPDQMNSFRLSTARGVQVPSLAGFGMQLSTSLIGGDSSTYLVGDPFSKAAITYSYEAAWTRQIPTLKGAFTANAFYVQNKRVMTFPGFDFESTENNPYVLDKEVVALVGKITNRGDFDSYGLELALNGKFNGKLDWEVNYTWNKIKEDFPLADVLVPGLGLPVLTPGFKEATPVHMANLRLGYTSGPFEADLYARFRSQITLFGDVPLTLPTPRDASLGVDARIAYHFGDHVEVYASVKNLANDGAVGLSTIDIDRRFMVGTRITF